MAKVRTRLKQYKVYKIPGRVGKVPDRVWGSRDFSQIEKYCEVLNESAKLPPATSSRFASAFKKIAKCFPDKNIADRWIWSESRTFIICSLGRPCWVVVEK